MSRSDMKIISTCIILFLFLVSNIESHSQDVYNLWEGKTIPHYKENTLKEYEEEFWGTTCILNVTKPTLTVYKWRRRSK